LEADWQAGKGQAQASGDEKLLRPGSEDARAHGCLCPIIDNNFGDGFPGPDHKTHFIYRMGCPLHGFAKESKCGILRVK
jgi:hypothetical protein